MAATVAVWVFSMGCQQAASYFVAREPAIASRLIGSWLAVIVALSAAAIVAMQLLLPVLFGAQSEEARDLARIYFFVVPGTLLFHLFSGVLLGDHEFRFLNRVQLVRVTALATSYAALALLDVMTVESALVATAATELAATGVVGVRAIAPRGIGRPSGAIARRSVWYGALLHGENVGGIIHTRLDIFIMPAILTSVSVGLYSVATNVAAILVTIAGVLTPIVLPASARRGHEGTRVVIASLHATTAVAVMIGVAIVLVAEVGIRLVYGGEFTEAATALRLLIPGCVLLSMGRVLTAGLAGLNRPGTVALLQLPAVAITVVGLLLFLETGGIEAAAIVSSVSYMTVFLGALVCYRQAAGLNWADFEPSKDDVAWVLSRLKAQRLSLRG